MVVETVGFPDYTKILASIDSKATTYTAIENCIAIGRMQCTTNSTAAVKINDVKIIEVGMSDSTNYRPQVPVYLPIKAGQTFGTGNAANYNINIYGLY